MVLDARGIHEEKAPSHGTKQKVQERRRRKNGKERKKKITIFLSLRHEGKRSSCLYFLSLPLLHKDEFASHDDEI